MERNGKGIFRESYTVGQGQAKPKGYTITEDCINCGACVKACPQRAITLGAPASSTRSTASTAATAWSIAPWRLLYQGSRRPSLRKLNAGFMWAIGGRGFLFWQCQPEEHFPSTSHLWFSLEYVLECRIFNNNKSDFL